MIVHVYISIKCNSDKEHVTVAILPVDMRS